MLLRTSISFFVLALIAYLLGANGIAGLSVDIGRTLLWVFLIVAAVSMLVHLVTGRSPRNRVP